jgi:hypothetical protein
MADREAGDKSSACSAGDESGFQCEANGLKISHLEARTQNSAPKFLD